MFPRGWRQSLNKKLNARPCSTGDKAVETVETPAEIVALRVGLAEPRILIALKGAPAKDVTAYVA